MGLRGYLGAALMITGIVVSQIGLPSASAGSLRATAATEPGSFGRQFEDRGPLGEAEGQHLCSLDRVIGTHLHAAGIVVVCPPAEGQQFLRSSLPSPTPRRSRRVAAGECRAPRPAAPPPVQQVAEGRATKTRPRTPAAAASSSSSAQRRAQGVAPPRNTDLAPRHAPGPGEGRAAAPWRSVIGETVLRGVPDEADDVADLAVVPDATQAHPAAGLWKLAGHFVASPLVSCRVLVSWASITELGAGS